MAAELKVNVIVVDEYTKQALSSYTMEDDYIEIVFSGIDRNFNPRYEVIKKALGESLQPLAKDFYRIALSVYISDRRFSRPSNVPIRNIKILLSVSDQKFWDHHKDNLEGVLRTLSGDNFFFHFVQGTPSRSQTTITRSIESEWKVSLFSGGLDSLAGVSWLRERNLKPILVSHTSANKITGLQRLLATNLEVLFSGEMEFHQINAKRIGNDLKANEDSQRLRSFLYLTLGCVFALHKGISELYIFENGILAVNIPMSSARISLNTQTVHPKFLIMYESLVSKIFGTEFSIINPFLEETKAEVVSHLDKKEFRDLIKNTVSCFRPTSKRFLGQSYKKVWHCGVCFPCIIRRIAINAAGLSSYDARYAEDILENIDNLPKDGKRIILDLQEFCRKLRKCNNFDEILDLFPKFIIDENIDPEPLIAMYLRHADEVTQFFS